MSSNSSLQYQEPPVALSIRDQVKGRQRDQGKQTQTQLAIDQSLHASTKRFMFAEWKDGKRAPISMYRGAAVVCR